jgi:bifunctional ADP-heptose synthase (sugar kinase/adenylyltransferase)
MIDKLIEADRKSPKRIWVLGDVMDDVWVYGELRDCQDHCLKFVESSRMRTPGGAAGARRQLDHWSSEAVLNGNIVSSEPTPTKTRFMANGKIAFRHDDEHVCVATHSFNVEHAKIEQFRRDRIVANLSKSLPDAVLLSDYDKGFLTPEFIRQIIDHCNQRKIPVVADAKREPKTYQGAILKCNEAYAEKFKKELAAHIGIVVITRGAKLPLILKNGQQVGTVDSA